ncbi:MAG TPA: Flp pilus assembly protein CpaB [Candidatus Limnocylindria bacterium]
MRETRSWIFLGVGLLLAALTGLSLYGVAQQNTPAQQAANVRTVDVIVAKADMPNRTVITAALLAHRSFPSDLVPAGVITNEADAVGQSTIAPIARGQVLVFSQLNSVEAARSASTTIEKGKVLVAFPTTDPLTTAGLVNVGDHVDLLASVLAGTGADAKVSQTTLQDLQVVDVLAPTKEQPGRVTSLVFAVDHQVALVLKYLRDAQATVDLAIRSRLETDLVKTTGVDLKYVVQTYGFQR